MSTQIQDEAPVSVEVAKPPPTESTAAAETLTEEAVQKIAPETAATEQPSPQEEKVQPTVETPEIPEAATAEVPEDKGNLSLEKVNLEDSPPPTEDPKEVSPPPPEELKEVIPTQSNVADEIAKTVETAGGEESAPVDTLL
eukprot:c27739_g1_i1 orf=416-838(-)